MASLWWAWREWAMKFDCKNAIVSRGRTHLMTCIERQLVEEWLAAEIDS
jgi:hypothetical protein